MLSNTPEALGPDVSVESALLRRLSAGPPEAGVGVIVLTTRLSLARLRDLAMRLQEVMTLLVVLPPRASDPTTDDADEFVERLAGALLGAPVHAVIGHSVAAYLAARLAKMREAQQPRRPKLVMLEPPLPDDLIRDPLSVLLFLPELVLQRFTGSLDEGCLATAPRGTPEFRRQLVRTFLTHRAELGAALGSVDPAELVVPPPSAIDFYTDWAGWVSLCMQLGTTTYEGPTVSIEGLYTANKPAPARVSRFARLRNSFPQVHFQETTMLHGDLLSEGVLRPHLTSP